MLTVAQLVAEPTSSPSPTSWQQDMVTIISSLPLVVDRYMVAHIVIRIIMVSLRWNMMRHADAVAARDATTTTTTAAGPLDALAGIPTTLIAMCVWCIGNLMEGMMAPCASTTTSGVIYAAIDPRRILYILACILHDSTSVGRTVVAIGRTGIIGSSSSSDGHDAATAATARYTVTTIMYAITTLHRCAQSSMMIPYIPQITGVLQHMMTHSSIATIQRHASECLAFLDHGAATVLFL